MAFPSTLDSFPSATTLASQDLSTTPHSTLHGNLGNAVAALEAKVGVDSSAVTTSIDYLLKHFGGDVGGTSSATVIQPGAVTLAKMANLAANSFIGNNTVSSAVPAALTQQQSLDLISGAQTNNQVLAGNGTHVTLRALTTSDLPTGTASNNVPVGGVISAGGPTGGATTVPVITYNAAGQLTAVTTAAVSGAGIDTTALHAASNLSDLNSASSAKTNLKVGYADRRFARNFYR